MFIVVVVTVIILGTLVGNVLVVVAVFTSRALKAPQNLFLVSLASADILVATLVIPFSLANEVRKPFFFFKITQAQLIFICDLDDFFGQLYICLILDENVELPNFTNTMNVCTKI